jgi:hypothetical protein
MEFSWGHKNKFTKNRISVIVGAVNRGSSVFTLTLHDVKYGNSSFSQY